MDCMISLNEHTVLPEWRSAMELVARALGMPFHPVLVRGWLEGHQLLACVRHLGGEMLPTPAFDGWVLEEDEDARRGNLEKLMPDMYAGEVGIGDFHGIVELRLGGDRFLALRTDERLLNYAVRPALVLGGPSLEATLSLAGRIKTAQAEILRMTKRLRVYGSHLDLAERAPVAESDLILPAAFKTSLFEYLDRFWRAATICATLRLAPSRGVLFVGAPGTGKTQTIRHLIHRYPDCSFSVYMPPPPGGNVKADSVFEFMLSEIAVDGRPAVVVIEDIDRLFDQGGMTPQVFLNAVDGLFQSDSPILWIATSNDPSELEANILDRPGRFDRIVVFELPGSEERLALLKRFSPWPVDPELLAEVAREADGLSGAHIKELCLAAALASAEAPESYGAGLMPELRRIREQHERAERYDFGFGTTRPAGFGRGLQVAKVGTSGRPAAGEA